MTTSVRDIGDREQLQVTFKNLSDVNTNPTLVTLTIRTPDGTETTVSGADSPAPFGNASTGVFTYDYTYAQAGRHFFHWAGTGALVAAAPQERYVLRKNVS